MVHDAVFVLHHLAVQFIDQVVHRGIQVFVGAFGKEVVAFDMNVALRSLAFLFLFLLFNREQNFHIHHLIEMSSDSVQFACDVASKGWRDFEVVTTDCQIHKKPPDVLSVKQPPLCGGTG
jgi:hypothetical protein